MNGIIWNPDPVLLWIGPLAIRYYSLLMTGGMLIGYLHLGKRLQKEKIGAVDRDRLFIQLLFGIFAGARLIHCFFYDPGYYLGHPLEIILPVEIGPDGIRFTGFTGLASHGGIIGLFAAAFWWCRRMRRPMIWLLDHLAFIAPLIAAMIRLGNFFNSEIIGTPSDLPWAVRFTLIDNTPRHPVQLYESICYLILFLILLSRSNIGLRRRGQATGVVLTYIFTVRFLLEFFKTPQEEYVSQLPLSMGQLLSIPFLLMGLWLWFRTKTDHTEET